MKIAQIAPLMESVPPRLYGGTERVVSYLTEDLVAQGHEVTLFASGDSITAANLVPCCTQALRLDPAVSDAVPYYMLMLDKVRSHAAEFDVLHFHIDHFHFPIFRHLPIPSLTTLHGRQDHRDCLPFFAGFSDMPLISISDAQRAPLPHANFLSHDPPQPPAKSARGQLSAQRRLSCLRGPYLAGKGACRRRTHCPELGHPAQDRGQGGQTRRILFPRGRATDAFDGGRRVHRRDQREGQGA